MSRGVAVIAFSLCFQAIIIAEQVVQEYLLALIEKLVAEAPAR